MRKKIGEVGTYKTRVTTYTFCITHRKQTKMKLDNNLTKIKNENICERTYYAYLKYFLRLLLFTLFDEYM